MLYNIELKRQLQEIWFPPPKKIMNQIHTLDIKYRKTCYIWMWADFPKFFFDKLITLRTEILCSGFLNNSSNNKVNHIWHLSSLWIMHNALIFGDLWLWFIELLSHSEIMHARINISLLYETIRGLAVPRKFWVLIHLIKHLTRIN